MALVASPSSQAQSTPLARHVIVYRQAGRFGGWPANHGIWSWQNGREILVGFSAAWFEKREPGRHQMNSQRGEEPRQARSLDGGLTWKLESPPGLMPPEFGGAPIRPLDTPIDFQRPGFAMAIKFVDNHVGPSRLWYTYDRGRSWQGGFAFNVAGLDAPGIAARTDYVVTGPREATVFLTAAKSNRREGRPFLARTTDGGLTWKVVAMIGPEPPEGQFSIMPSSLLLDPLSGGRAAAAEWLTTVRYRKTESENWIEQFRSTDHGASWKSEGRIADTGEHAGNPPHLIRLRGGRLCLTYASRSAPYPILAKLSKDQGRTWSERPVTIRADAAAWDMGYVRSAQRPDGSVVTIYYYNDGPHNERFIAASIWKPE